MHLLSETAIAYFDITPPHSGLVKKLYDPQTYLNPSIWKNAVGELHDWFMFSCQLLEHYYNWWIRGYRLKNHDLKQKLEEAELFDPTIEETKEQWE